jgi:hypothetical protein
VLARGSPGEQSVLSAVGAVSRSLSQTYGSFGPTVLSPLGHDGACTSFAHRHVLTAGLMGPGQVLMHELHG